MNPKTINIARDFSPYPAGRVVGDGPFSGEKFREEFLIPSLNANQPLRVELDGTRGYGSSFLEEAFGGLVRRGIGSDRIHQLLTLVSTDESLKKEIEEYIEQGANE